MKRVNINIDNRVHYTLLAIAFVLILGIGVYALAPSIDTSSGYHESEQVSIMDSSGVEKTLQEAINDGSLIPSGAVMAFDLTGCPDGWSEYTSARDRTIIGSGSSYTRGATGGEATHTLTVAEMPSHRHSFGANSGPWDGVSRPLGWSLQTPSTHYTAYTGGGAAHNNMQPYIALLYCKKN